MLEAGLNRVNALPSEDLRPLLSACLDIQRWVQALLDGRPFTSEAELMKSADTHARTITPEEVHGALARHPRIGERATGTDTESRWSRREQSAMAEATDATREALRAGNLAYERRFGHIYLVCATGLTSDEMLANLTARMDNDQRTEVDFVAEELRKIAAVRLHKLLAQQAGKPRGSESHSHESPSDKDHGEAGGQVSGSWT